MKRVVFFFLILFVALSVDAQAVRRLPCDYWCQWYGPAPTWRRVIPIVPPEPLNLPKGVGVIVAYSDIPKYPTAGYTEGWNIALERNKDSAQALVDMGIRTVKLWPRTHAYGWDMKQVYENPDLDVIVVRPMQNAWSEEQGSCVEGQHSIWVTEDYGKIAMDLYERFGHLDKVIILTGWEADHLVKNLGCEYNEEYNYSSYVKTMLDNRQAGVEAARAAYPDALLRVYHAVDINDINNNFNVVRDLDLEPDIWSLSYWKWGTYTITEMLEYIVEQTGYRPDRIIIGEVGGPVDKQYDRIVSAVTDAMEFGCPLVYVWLYVQDWGGDNFGLWAKDEDGLFTGQWTEGMDAIVAMNEVYN